MRTGFWFRSLAAVTLPLLLCAGHANAEDTLAKIANSGEFVLGHRDKSLPFSYVENGKPVGYTVEICQQIFEEVKKELKRPDLKIRYALVQGANRISDVKNGAVDVECGGTANTLARQKEIAFSHHIFVASSAFLVKKNSGFDTIAKLSGKKIAVQGKTTNEALLHANEKTYGNKFELVLTDSTGAAVDAVVSGKADAAFADDAGMWVPLIKSGSDTQDYVFLEKRLSIEPYSIGFRKDDEKFKALVHKVTRGMFTSGEMTRLYKKWFNSEKGMLPMSTYMKEAFQRPSDYGVVPLAF